MTDDEIRQSHIDHYHQRAEIEALVCAGTPSRRGWGLRNLRGKREAYDYVLHRYVKVE